MSTMNIDTSQVDAWQQQMKQLNRKRNLMKFNASKCFLQLLKRLTGDDNYLEKQY